MNSLWLFEV